MKIQTVFKRYEIKYLITEERQAALKNIMSRYMDADKYGKSTISNIYFDTPDDLLIRRSIEKPVYKEKLRVRSYGTANENSTVFVELKKKYKNVVYKRRIAMTEESADDYLLYGKLPEKKSQIVDEINYFCSHYEDLSPKVFISYEREAFYSKTDPNFRMTFDTNILYRNEDLTLTSPPYGSTILPAGKVLMEVKTAGAIPLWLTQFLSENKIYKTSFSKYGNAYLKSLYVLKGAQKYV